MDTKSKSKSQSQSQSGSEFQSKSNSNSQSESQVKSWWIVSPLIDLFFVCGGALVLLTVMHSCASLAGATHQLRYCGDLAVLLALLLGETHTVSTIFAADASAAQPQFSRYRHIVAVVSIVLIFIVCVFGWLAPYVVRLYLLAVSWHFISQARGIIFIYLRKSEYSLSSFQHFVWNLLLWLSIVNWMLVQLSSYFGDKTESFLYHNLSVIHLVPKAFVDVVVAVIVLFSCVAVVDLLLCKLARKPLPPLPAIVLLAFSVLLFFPCNPMASLQPSLWLFAPALFHGSQYLCVVGAKIAKNNSLASESAKLTFLLTTYGQCLLFSVLIFLFLPWLLATLCQPFGLSYAVAVAAIFVGVQVYHMAIDSVIWRRRAGVS